jgi:NitT/TauT family transport system substrate-binding protein
MTKQSKLAVALLAVVSVAALALFLATRGSPRPPQQRVVIAQFGDVFLYAPLYVAIDNGYFTEQGLEASLVSTGGDEKTWAAVMSGNASFGIADPTFVAVSGARGNPGIVVATLIPRVPFWGITFRTDVNVAQPSDLKPWKVATFPSPSTAYTLQRRMFENAGLKPSIREGAFGTLITMAKSGEADIALELEPNVTTATQQGARVVYGLQELYGPLAITGLTTTPELIKSNPAMVQKVVCALQQALSLIHTNPDRALDILVARFPEIDRNVAKAALARSIEAGVLPKTTVTSPESWSNAIDLRIAVGDLKEPAPFLMFVNNSFAQQAAESCSTNSGEQK